jgi:hypothetical protein
MIPLPPLSEISGLEIALILLLGLIIESVILVAANHKYVLGKYDRDEGNVIAQSSEYASRALTFSSLTFAGLTFVLAQTDGEGLGTLSDTVFLFTVGFTYFVLSYKMDVYAAVRRVYFSTQQRLFNFGLLSLVSGLVMYFSQVSDQLLLPVAIGAILIFVLHLIEYIGDVQDYASGGLENGSQSSLSDF